MHHGILISQGGGFVSTKDDVVITIDDELAKSTGIALNAADHRAGGLGFCGGIAAR